MDGVRGFAFSFAFEELLQWPPGVRDVYQMTGELRRGE
ncbi:hypothetical protein VULLAG_LOCUS17649 [Vulpes lagopus]